MSAPSQTPPRLLLFGEELRLRASRRVAVCFGGEVTSEVDPARVVEQTRALKPAVVLFDLDHAGPDALGLADAIVAASPTSRIVALCHPSPPESISTLLDRPWFAHLLGLQSPWFMEELGATLTRLTGGPLFGLHRHLPWGTRILSTPVSSSQQKEALFERIEAYMADIGVRGRLVSRLHDVADEMLMNAVYDAPVDRATGAHPYAALPRTTRVDLPPDSRPTFSYGSDGRIFALSIADPFGGLTPEILKRYIAKGLRRGSDQIDRKAGGAGLGLYFLFQSLNSMTLYLQPGRRTEMVGLVDIRGSFRDVLKSPKALNIYVRDGEDGR